MTVAFSAQGNGGGAQNGFITGLTATGSITPVTGDTVLLGYTARVDGLSRASQTRSVTLGGSAMTLLGFIEYFTNEAFCELWVATNVTGGSSLATSVSVSSGSNAGREIIQNCISYSGVGSVGATSTNSGNSTSASISSITSATGEIVAGMFGANSGALSAFSPTGRHADNTGDNFANMIMGEAAGSGSVSLSATVAASVPWGGIFVRLAPPATTHPGFFAMF